jgi:hypothetical protein
MGEDNIATVEFNRIWIENEIRFVWNQIKLTREDPAISKPVKVAELVRLFEVQNALEVEMMRHEEKYLSLLLQSLNLEDLNAQSMLEGKRKCHLTEARQTKPNKGRAESLSCRAGYGRGEGAFLGLGLMEWGNQDRESQHQQTKDIKDQMARLSYMGLSERDLPKYKALQAELKRRVKK